MKFKNSIKQPVTSCLEISRHGEFPIEILLKNQGHNKSQFLLLAGLVQQWTGVTAKKFQKI